MRVEGANENIPRVQNQEIRKSARNWQKVSGAMVCVKWTALVLSVMASLASLPLFILNPIPTILVGTLIAIGSLSAITSLITDIAHAIMLGAKRKKMNPVAIHFGPGPD